MRLLEALVEITVVAESSFFKIVTVTTHLFFFILFFFFFSFFFPSFIFPLQNKNGEVAIAVATKKQTKNEIFSVLD